ncbi:MAG: hypothetical protein F4W90_07940 [Gammaproteobacteria bacterium]|nr:hypothetical protein [Gammaproteobacteria bacterium]
MSGSTSVPASPKNPNLLSDHQLLHYLTAGYVVFEDAELGTSFHERMFQAACLTYGLARGAAAIDQAPHIRVIADNLRSRIPEVDHLLASPTVNGAIESVLGKGWQLYPHDFIHESSPNDQSFHQDGNLPWNDRGHYRSHRPDWAMLFYYPQTTDISAGPTEVLPGTQYWTNDYELPNDKWHRGDPMGRLVPQIDNQVASIADRDEYLQKVADSWGVANLERRKLTVPCGGLVLASYDLAHRGTRTSADFSSRRFMYKFYLYRATAPSKRLQRQVDIPQTFTSNRYLEPIVEKNWYWLQGESGLPDKDVLSVSSDELISTSTEPERVRIAYQLGRSTNRSRERHSELAALLQHDDEAVRRAAGYAFGLVENVEPALFTNLLADDRAPVRRATVLAMREAMCCTKDTILWLYECLENDQDDLVRSNVAYTLGIFARAQPELFASHERLIGRLDHAVEPDNTNNGGMMRSTVRENVALALTMMQLNNSEAEQVLHYTLREHDRYAKSLLLIAIQRSIRGITEPWIADLVGNLVKSRFVT